MNKHELKSIRAMLFADKVQLSNMLECDPEQYLEWELGYLPIPNDIAEKLVNLTGMVQSGIGEALKEFMDAKDKRKNASPVLTLFADNESYQFHANDDRVPNWLYLIVNSIVNHVYHMTLDMGSSLTVFNVTKYKQWAKESGFPLNTETQSAWIDLQHRKEINASAL